ncbi:hypothetical protein SAMN04489760_13119 [Syntrophus gentianae]|uniref:Uncharacterized protein n=1 Tax=Syntrophus gentianae TaxID=43775 RepID=A0A1H8A5P9_9BACT|nr:hypothetical protein SAMN04489760_13119 [Syntrophus gentianae]
MTLNVNKQVVSIGYLCAVPILPVRRSCLKNGLKIFIKS